jgi:hypothetical protein
MAARTTRKNTPDDQPFADEAQTDLTPPWEEDVPDEDTASEDKPKEKVVTVGSEGKITVTLKGGKGYEAPWIVIHGSDAADILSTMSEENFPKLINWTATSSQRFQEKCGNGGGGSTPTESNGRPYTATQAPSGDKKYCKHGEMVPRSGSKNGKPWSGHFCPTPQGTPDQCKPEFGK